MKIKATVFIILLSYSSSNLFAPKTDQITQVNQDDKATTRTQKLKQWIQDHKALSAIIAAMAVAGIGTAGYFIGKKVQESRLIKNKKNGQSLPPVTGQKEEEKPSLTLDEEAEIAKISKNELKTLEFWLSNLNHRVMLLNNSMQNYKRTGSDFNLKSSYQFAPQNIKEVAFKKFNDEQLEEGQLLQSINIIKHEAAKIQKIIDNIKEKQDKPENIKGNFNLISKQLKNDFPELVSWDVD